MAPNTTALQAALKGEKVPDRQTKSALGAAVNKIASLTRRAERSKRPSPRPALRSSTRQSPQAPCSARVSLKGTSVPTS